MGKWLYLRRNSLSDNYLLNKSSGVLEKLQSVNYVTFRHTVRRY